MWKLISILNRRFDKLKEPVRFCVFISLFLPAIIAIAIQFYPIVAILYLSLIFLLRLVPLKK